MSVNNIKENVLPFVSIIILNYNGKKFLDKCLLSISEVSYPVERLEVILVDNASSDCSVSYVNAKYPWVHVVRLEKNYGFTGGNNAGVKIAKGEYIVLLNNDVAVDREWLIELVKIALKYPNSITTSKSLLMSQPQIIDCVGAKATPIGRGFCIDFGRKDNLLENSPKFVVQPYGASMLVKKSVFEIIGEFDEDYFTSLEDTDFGLRAWLYGYKIIFVPTSVFYHVGGGTGGWGKKTSNTMVFHGTKNSYLNILKNYDFKHVVEGISLSLLFYMLTILFSIRDYRKSDLLSIVQGHVWILRNLDKVVKKRLQIKWKKTEPYRILFNPSFFASLPEMIHEYSIIQSFNRTNYV